MLKLRLAITLFFLCALLPLLIVFSFADTQSSLWVDFGPYALVFVLVVAATLLLPLRHGTNWLTVGIISIALYCGMVIALHQLQFGPLPSFYPFAASAVSLLLLSYFSSWINHCIASYESSVHKLALTETLSDIQDPISEERVQSMLMHSRYTGQPLGVIALDVDPDAKKKFQSSLEETLVKNLAEEHWQAEISRNLRKEIRLIDTFYKDRSNGRLLLVCPGLSDTELAALSVKLEKIISDKSNAESECRYVSFPDQAITLDGLLTMLDAELQEQITETATVSLMSKFEKDNNKSPAVRSG